MRRPYTKAEYLSRIEEIRRRIPGLSISTDLIVGFPGESDTDFEETAEFLGTCRFSFLHVFPFSPRSGTMAASMSGQIPADVKKERAKICLNLSEELYDRYMDSLIGKERDVLIETHEDGRSRGRISEYAEVCLPELLKRGTMVKAELLSRDHHMLYGERKANHETE